MLFKEQRIAMLSPDPPGVYLLLLFAHLPLFLFFFLFPTKRNKLLDLPQCCQILAISHKVVLHHKGRLMSLGQPRS